jgi:cupin 2 domain-containing protein
MEIKNLFADIKYPIQEEICETILDNSNFRLERIISTGQSTPEGTWYDQDTDEWVIMLSGVAGLLFKGDSEVKALKAGDYLLIPAHTVHRVEWTDSREKTIWLAIHFSARQKW